MTWLEAVSMGKLLDDNLNLGIMMIDDDMIDDGFLFGFLWLVLSWK